MDKRRYPLINRILWGYLLLMVAVVSACGTDVRVVTVTPMPATQTPYVVTATPDVTVTRVPTAGPDATPTPEVLQENIDCQTLTVTADEFPTTNANPCMRVFGSALYSEGVGDPARQWDRVEPFEILYAPGSVGLAPFAYWKDIGEGVPRGIRMDVSWVNGRFGYSQPGIWLKGGQRYILKLEVVSGLFDNGGAGASLGGAIAYGTGERVNLPQWGMQRGPVEAIWVIETSVSRVVTWEAWTAIQWANVTGNLTWQGMRVEIAPDGFGDDVVIEF